MPAVRHGHPRPPSAFRDFCRERWSVSSHITSVGPSLDRVILASWSHSCSWFEFMHCQDFQLVGFSEAGWSTIRNVRTPTFAQRKPAIAKRESVCVYPRLCNLVTAAPSLVVYALVLGDKRAKLSTPAPLPRSTLYYHYRR